MSDILEYKSYYATIQFSAEDEVFHGKIIGINDLVTFEGITVRELKKAFHGAVDDYIDTCRDSGKDPEKTYKGTFNVRIPAELHREAAKEAALKNISLNDFVRSAIDFMLRRPPDHRTVKFIWLCASLLGPALIAGFSLNYLLYLGVGFMRA